MKISYTPVRALLLATLLATAVTPVIAQTADPTPARDMADATDNNDNDGFDWGLLGLLGLLGLIPRKQNHVVHDTNRNTTNTR